MVHSGHICCEEVNFKIVLLFLSATTRTCYISKNARYQVARMQQLSVLSVTETLKAS